MEDVTEHPPEAQIRSRKRGEREMKHIARGTAVISSRLDVKYHCDARERNQ